ncbi:MAG TPA: lactate racemase domain-containing protein [Planctomycetaceae bacterium]|nr:lactate racemase domain-containing protein [Planctomycetaceae bacterium]
MCEITLPWGAWYLDGAHQLALPERCHVDVLDAGDISPCPLQAVHAAIASPCDGTPLVARARGSRSACVVVDDLARPTPASAVLPFIIEQLNEAHIAAEAIHIVVATGSHGMLDNRQLAWKVGPDVLARYDVKCHDCQSGLAPSGVTYGSRELKINRTFLEADFKMTIGSVLPHSFAGYSGGAKMVLPGLADLAATARSHKFVQLGLRGGTDPNSNRFRLEAEDLARRLGLQFCVNVVTNRRREIVGVFAGDLVTAHREACRLAEQAFRTRVLKTYDCLLINAYPKDIDLIQAENAFVALKTARAPLVHDGGVIILATAASEGLGCHGLFQPGGASYQAPQRKRAFGNRELWLYAPSVTTDDVHQLYWEGYPVLHNPDELKAALARRFPGPAAVGVLPCGPMQQIDDLREGIARVA